MIFTENGVCSFGKEKGNFNSKYRFFLAVDEGPSTCSLYSTILLGATSIPQFFQFTFWVSQRSNGSRMQSSYLSSLLRILSYESILHNRKKHSLYLMPQASISLPYQRALIPTPKRHATRVQITTTSVVPLHST